MTLSIYLNYRAVKLLMAWKGYVYRGICQQVLRENHKTSVRLGGFYAKTCTRDHDLPNIEQCQPVHCSIQYSNYKNQQAIPDDNLYFTYHKTTYDTVCCSGTDH